MNYFTLEAWEHPNIKEVCAKVLSQGFQSKPISRQKIGYTDSLGQFAFEWSMIWKYDNDTEIELSVNSRNVFFINLLKRTGEDTLSTQFLCRLENLSHKNLLKTKENEFDLTLLGRGLYWMGFTSEFLGVLKPTFEQEKEWEKERITSWQQSPEIWGLRPECLVSE